MYLRRLSQVWQRFPSLQRLREIFDLSAKASITFAAIAALWPIAQYTMEAKERRLARAVSTMQLVDTCRAVFLPEAHRNGPQLVEESQYFEAFICANSLDLQRIAEDMGLTGNLFNDDATRRIFFTPDGNAYLQAINDPDYVPPLLTFGD